MDTVAVTKMIRQMQQAGASPDEIRRMIAETLSVPPEIEPASLSDKSG